MSTAKHLLFFDGVCVMCNQSVRLVHRLDRRDVFLFAALQSPLAEETLAREGHDARRLEGVYVLLDRGTPAERLVGRYTAVREILKALGGGWKVLGLLMGLVPTRLGNWGYELVARNRYRLFGKYEACAMPDPSLRHKVLADAPAP
jgi:predicted DCC family thiol-disulfide oxidoreductase YuxK